MNESIPADGAVVADVDMIGFERPILKRVALEYHHLVYRAVVTDGNQGPLRNPNAIVKQLFPDLDTVESPDKALERHPREQVQVRILSKFPVTFMLPIIIIIDGAELWLKSGKT